jgi:hypothetical protein
MSDQITCPQCGSKITITQALRSQLEAESQAKFSEQVKQLKAESHKQQQQLKQQEEALAKRKQDLEVEIKRQTEAAKRELWQKAQSKAKESIDLEMKDLKEQLSEQKQKHIDFEKQELAWRKEKREIEDKQRRLQIELEEQLAKERQSIVDKIEKEYEERMRLKMLEKEKQLQDTQHALDEARRKAAQGSQQNQGEVLELDLEESLTEAFPQDIVEPVGKGVTGADVVQTVRTPQGMSCGVLLWESKHTKHWKDQWVDKLKEDLRQKKANVPIIVTAALPKEISSFGQYQGVWVTQVSFALQLAGALRNTLLQVQYERLATQGKGEKQELLYDYVASHEFRQRVEAIVEVYVEMQQQIDKEQAAFARLWKQRQMQLKRLFVNTAGMYGEMQGLVGASLPEIKGLELESLKSGDKKDELKLF